MDSRRNFDGGNDPMSNNKAQMPNKKPYFAGSISQNMCTASTSSTSSRFTDSGISSGSSQSTLSKYECVQYSSFPNCDDVDDKYERIAKIGQGTYGEVFKARNPSTNEYVALKRIMGDNGRPGVSILFTYRIGSRSVTSWTSCYYGRNFSSSFFLFKPIYWLLDAMEFPDEIYFIFIHFSLKTTG